MGFQFSERFIFMGPRFWKWHQWISSKGGVLWGKNWESILNQLWRCWKIVEPGMCTSVTVPLLSDVCYYQSGSHFGWVESDKSTGKICWVDICYNVFHSLKFNMWDVGASAYIVFREIANGSQTSSEVCCVSFWESEEYFHGVMLMENKKQVWHDRGTSSSLNLLCHEAKLILHSYCICKIFTSHTIESVP